MKMHPGITLDYLEDKVREERGAYAVTEQRKATLSLLLALLAEQRALGYKFWPAGCGSMGPDGHCAGHE